jgi:glucose/arabinose dehydrogenase
LERKNVACQIVPPADVEFPAHAAPLGLEYIEPNFRDRYLQDSFLVALHGSSDISIGSGYKIVKVTRDKGEVSDFITGFLQKGCAMADQLIFCNMMLPHSFLRMITKELFISSL